MIDGKSIFFNFVNIADMEDVSNKLIRLRKTGHYPNM